MTSLHTEPEQTAKPASAEPLAALFSKLDAARELLAAQEQSAAYIDLYVLCSDLLRLIEVKIREVEPEAELAPDQLASVCILLGPYRNLTTLTSSVLGLHPQCIVLNHAGPRTLRNPRLNFLVHYSPDKFAEFVRYAGFAARGGERGMQGGDIRLSHAYAREAMRQAQAALARSPGHPVRCLVWKESQKVANCLRSEGVDVQALLRANPKLRFLLPVRNPIDCAISNLRQGHVHFLAHRGVSRASSVEAVVAAVLDEFAWFFALREKSRRPECFFHYFEHQMDRAVLDSMLRFLDLPVDDAYLAAAATAFRPDRTVPKSGEIVARYAELVEQKFAHAPEIRDGLLRFAR